MYFGVVKKQNMQLLSNGKVGIDYVCWFSVYLERIVKWSTQSTCAALAYCRQNVMATIKSVYFSFFSLLSNPVTFLPVGVNLGI